MTSLSGNSTDAIVQRLFRASLEVTGALALADAQAAGPLREVIERLDASIKQIQGQALGSAHEHAAPAVGRGQPAAGAYRVRPCWSRLVGHAGIRPGPAAVAGQVVLRRSNPGPAADW
jgi:hypothetical protein